MKRVRGRLDNGPCPLLALPPELLDTIVAHGDTVDRNMWARTCTRVARRSVVSRRPHHILVATAVRNYAHLAAWLVAHDGCRYRVTTRESILTDPGAAIIIYGSTQHTFTSPDDVAAVFPASALVAAVAANVSLPTLRVLLASLNETADMVERILVSEAIYVAHVGARLRLLRQLFLYVSPTHTLSASPRGLSHSGGGGVVIRRMTPELVPWLPHLITAIPAHHWTIASVDLDTPEVLNAVSANKLSMRIDGTYAMASLSQYSLASCVPHWLIAECFGTDKVVSALALLIRATDDSLSVDAADAILYETVRHVFVHRYDPSVDNEAYTAYTTLVHHAMTHGYRRTADWLCAAHCRLLEADMTETTHAKQFGYCKDTFLPAALCDSYHQHVREMLQDASMPHMSACLAYQFAYLRVCVARGAMAHAGEIFAHLVQRVSVRVVWQYVLRHARVAEIIEHAARVCDICVLRVHMDEAYLDDATLTTAVCVLDEWAWPRDDQPALYTLLDAHLNLLMDMDDEYV